MDESWPATVFYLVAAQRRLRNPDHAAALHALLTGLDRRDRTFAGLVYYGSYRRHRGMLATITGEHSRAVADLTAAHDHYRSIGATTWSTLAQADLAAATDLRTVQ